MLFRRMKTENLKVLLGRFSYLGPLVIHTQYNSGEGESERKDAMGVDRQSCSIFFTFTVYYKDDISCWIFKLRSCKNRFKDVLTIVHYTCLGGQPHQPPIRHRYSLTIYRGAIYDNNKTLLLSRQIATSAL